MSARHGAAKVFLLVCGLASCVRAQADRQPAVVENRITIIDRRGHFHLGDGVNAAEPQRLVIRDSQQLARFVARDSAYWEGAKFPTIDFTKEMVLVAGLGIHPTADRAVVIDALKQRHDSLFVAVVTVDTPSGCTVSPSFSSPLDILVVPYTSKPVAFREVRIVDKLCLARGMPRQDTTSLRKLLGP